MKEWTGMDFARSPRESGQLLKLGQDEKGLLRSHLWCPTTLQSYGID